MKNSAGNWTIACAMLLLAAVPACGPVDDGLPRTVNASGTILLNGSPLEGASIIISDTTGTYSAQAMSDSSGAFSLNAYESKPGAVPGEYMVQVSKTVQVDFDKNPTAAKKMPQEEGEHAGDASGVHWINDLPTKYARFNSSGLKISVPEDGTSDIKLEISDK